VPRWNPFGRLLVWLVARRLAGPPRVVEGSA